MLEKEVDFLAGAVTTPKNRHSNRSGYSRPPRVIRENVHMPASLLSNDVLEPEMMAACPSAKFHRAAAMRLPPCCRPQASPRLAQLRADACGPRIMKSATVTLSSCSDVWPRP